MGAGKEDGVEREEGTTRPDSGSEFVFHIKGRG